MRSNPITSWIAIVAVVAAGCTTASPGSTSTVSTPDGVELEAVIGAIQRALVESESHEAAGFPPLKSVMLKLQTVAARSAGGEVRVLVFSAGASVKTETGSTIEIEMKPPPPPGRKGLRPEDVTEALARAIAAAKQGLVRASQGDPPLVAKSVRIDLKFAVAWDGSAGGAVKLLPVGLEGSGGISRDRAHTISLVFAP
jgi:hypothetical protein